MEKDMHYYGILYLATAAGYSPKDAQVIAYASQYVDDSTQDQPIIIAGEAPFQPILTMNMLQAFFSQNPVFSEIQMEALVPFHFLPTEPTNAPGFSYVTQPNSKLADMLLQEAAKDHSAIRFHRIGVALHTYADTWSHQMFSGRDSDEENGVVSCFQLIEGQKEEENGYLGLPAIGHAKVGHCPDYPYLHWTYEAHGETFERDNPSIFLEAASRILARLADFRPGGDRPWASVQPELRSLLGQGGDLKERCRGWKESVVLRGLFGSSDSEYDYEETKWFKEALTATGRTEKFSNRPEFKIKGEQGELDFFHFHEAALLQRDFIRGHLA